MFDFKKLKGKPVKKDSAEYEAHKNVLGAIKKSAEDKIADGVKKVTVASNDEAGLKEGLDKAKEIIGSGKLSEMAKEALGGESDEGSLEEESLESPEEESAEMETPDQEINELEKQMQEMMKKLEELKAKKA
jgi:hypothetical protein